MTKRKNNRIESCTKAMGLGAVIRIGDVGQPNNLVPLATAVYFRGVVKILHVIHQPNYLAVAVHIIDKVNPLEYQQNKFSLQFCPAYNLPIWQLITSADFC